MAIRALGLLVALLLLAFCAWTLWSSRRGPAASEKVARARQARALRAAGWREDHRTGRWSHPTKTNGELLLSEAELVEATGSDWPEELRR